MTATGRASAAPEQIAAEIEARLSARMGVRKGDELGCLCPFHEETKPSFSYNVVKGAYYCQACKTRGGWKKLAQQLGITTAPDRGARRRQAKAARRIVAEYDYRDERGELLFQTVRFDPKDFRQRRPNGAGDWIWDLDGVRRVLYRTPEISSSAASGDVVYVVEGQKDVETLRGEGMIATCNPMGAGKWRREYAEQLLVGG